MDVEWDSSSSHAEVRSLAPRTPNAAPPPALPWPALWPWVAASTPWAALPADFLSGPANGKPRRGVGGQAERGVRLFLGILSFSLT